jgi:septum formation protein
MGSTNTTIVLASSSPRRAELISLAAIEFVVVPADICEDPLPGELPADHVMRLSREKAAAVAAKVEGRFFIGADTIVVLEGTILGKPHDDGEAFRMLTALSGRGHKVITGFTVLDTANGSNHCSCVSTDVFFKTLSEDEINSYIASGCPRDKAGAYAIQGGAVHFVRSINGSYTNVIGLPMTELYEVLQAMQALPIM